MPKPAFGVDVSAFFEQALHLFYVAIADSIVKQRLLIIRLENGRNKLQVSVQNDFKCMLLERSGNYQQRETQRKSIRKRATSRK